jgi:cyclase
MTARLVEIVDGVHAWLQPDGGWWLNNAGAVRGPDGIVLIDTCATRRRTEAFLAGVSEVTDNQPIRVAVNTHAHGDHCYGNALLPEATMIVAHENTRADLLADFVLRADLPIWQPRPDWGITAIRPPTVVLRDTMTLFAGDRRLELRHPGYPAHTRGDVVAWLPDERVLFTGDLVFHRVTPMVLTGQLAGALRSLDWLAGFDAHTVVPGHGPLIGPGDFDEVLAAHERYYRLIAGAVAAGRTPLEVARGLDLGEFTGLPDAERVVLNLHVAYADAAGTPVDPLAAFTDAITYHGGPLSCAL